MMRPYLENEMMQLLTARSFQIYRSIPFDRLTSVVIRLWKTKSNSKSRSHEFQEKKISISFECYDTCGKNLAVQSSIATDHWITFAFNDDVQGLVLTQLRTRV